MKIPFTGHTRVRELLESHLPTVFLLRGPESVGKRTLVLGLREHHGYRVEDFFFREQLDMAAAQQARAFTQRVALGPAGKLLALRLDRASDSAIGVLLKTLEEPPPRVVFALLCTLAPIATVISRAECYSMGLLTEAELRQVLLTRLGMVPDLARRAARLGRGQVRRALLTDSRTTSRAVVLSVLKSLADGDPLAFETATRSWDSECHDLLLVWITEAVTGVWAVFAADDFPGLSLDRSIPRRMLGAMRPGAKPRLAVRSALSQFLDV